MSAALSGRGVVITRPLEHALGLAERTRGWRHPIVFRQSRSCPRKIRPPCRCHRAPGGNFSLAIFVSPTAAFGEMLWSAASRAMAREPARGRRGSWDRRRARRRGFRDVISPRERPTGEGCRMPELGDFARQFGSHLPRQGAATGWGGAGDAGAASRIRRMLPPRAADVRPRAAFSRGGRAVESRRSRSRAQRDSRTSSPCSRPRREIPV